MRAISTHGLTKIFNDARAVDAVTVHIERGEIYGLIGKNGAGKSTLMKMIAGLTIPTSGDIEALDPNVILHVNTMFPTPLALFAELTFSDLALLSLVVAYAGLEAFFEDLNVGFIKTICSSTLGRGGYPLEKVIFLGIITLMGFVLLMPISIVTALVTGSTFSTLDGMGGRMRMAHHVGNHLHPPGAGTAHTLEAAHLCRPRHPGRQHDSGLAGDHHRAARSVSQHGRYAQAPIASA